MSKDNNLLSRLRLGRILSCIVLLLVIWRLLPSGVKTWTGDLLHDLRVSAESRFSEVCKASDSVAMMANELKDLPSSSFFAKDQNDQAKRIRKKLSEIRKMLLPPESVGLADEIDQLDGEIKKVSAEKRNDKQERLSVLRAARRKAFKKLQAELAHIGLETKPVQDAALTVLTSEARTLIETAIVAKSSECIVEELRLKIDPESIDIEAAKRYCGVYLAMIEVQIDCFELYLEKSENVWIPQLDEKEEKSENKLAEFEATATESGISTEKADAFRTLARRESRIAESIRRERERQLARAEAIRTKRDTALEKADIARAAYGQYNDIANLLRLISDMDASYDALSKLDIPALDLFDDGAVLAELE